MSFYRTLDQPGNKQLAIPRKHHIVQPIFDAEQAMEFQSQS